MRARTVTIVTVPNDFDPDIFDPDRFGFMAPGLYSSRGTGCTHGVCGVQSETDEKPYGAGLSRIARDGAETDAIPRWTPWCQESMERGPGTETDAIPEGITSDLAWYKAS